jgi:hypothetical protein
LKVSQKNEFLPEGPSDAAVDVGNLDFNEILDEEVCSTPSTEISILVANRGRVKELKSKLVVINRAPVMTAWSMVVAECLGFSREEALSIGAPATRSP